MTPTSRPDRLIADRDCLAALAGRSSIFSFAAQGELPDRYTLSFRGQGLARDPAAAATVAIIHLHQIDLRMPFSYPSSPPDIRWLSPLWHPCVSFSGFLNLTDAELDWSDDLPIGVVCERLWDIARGAFFPTGRAANYAARHWFERDCTFTLPVDHRRLCDRDEAGSSNIVRYSRRGGHGMQMDGVKTRSELIFIDENTPTPVLPERQPYVPVGLRRPDNKEVFYIGPE